MKGRTHLAFSVLIGILSILFIRLGMIERSIFFILVVLSSFIPDIDHPGSALGKTVKPISYFFKFTVGHRGIFHSLLLPLAFFLLLFGAGFPIYGLAVCLGYISHLILDSFNHSGVAWLFPLKARVRGNIKSGGFTDFIIFMFFLFTSVLVGIVVLR